MPRPQGELSWHAAHGNPTPRQLTLDGWADALSETPQPKTTAADAATGAGVKEALRQETPPTVRRSVVSGRSKSLVEDASRASGAARTAAALLTTREAAALLRVHPRTVQRLVERGELEAVHLGTAVRFDPGDVAGLTVRLKRREAGTKL